MVAPLLPLFPLSLVVLPGMSLPLHIFEERYKEMIGDVLPGKREFGIVLAKDEGIVNIGCTAVVQEILKRYPDGQLDLIAAGQRRFEIDSLDETKTYLQAEVQFFDDEDVEPPSDDLRKRVIAACEQLMVAQELPPGTELQPNDRRLSFTLGQLIADLDRRQTLLALRSETERLEFLMKMVPDYLVQRERITLARRVAPLNGHAKHVANS